MQMLCHGVGVQDPAALSWVRPVGDSTSLGDHGVSLLLPGALRIWGIPLHVWASGLWVEPQEQRGHLGKAGSWAQRWPAFACWDHFLFLAPWGFSVNTATVLLSWAFLIVRIVSLSNSLLMCLAIFLQRLWICYVELMFLPLLGSFFLISSSAFPPQTISSDSGTVWSFSFSCWIPL